MNNFEVIENKIKNKYSQSLCLANIDYWDSEGVEKKSELSSANNWELKRHESGKTVSWDALNSELGLELSVKFTLDGLDATLIVPRSDFKENGTCRIKNITILPGFVGVPEEEKSSLLIPFNSGVLCKTSGKKASESELPIFSTYDPYCNMPLCAVLYDDNHAMSVIIDGGLFDCTFKIRTCWGENKLYSIDPVFSIREYINENPLNEDISIYYHSHEGDNANYAGIGRYYRKYNMGKRKLPTLEQKVENNEILEYSSRAIPVRIRIGVKPMPVEILEQTPENEPPVNIFMTFEDVQKVAEEFARQGVGPAEFCLVGWNHGGHDGAFPQLFPVNEAAGGEEKLRQLIEKSHELGYPVTLHDNYHDIYSLANNFDENSIVKNHDGSRKLGGRYGGGQAYIICPKKAFELYASKSFKEVAELGIKGVYYVDVLSIINMSKCHNPDHPLSRREFAEWCKKIFGEQQKIFQGSSSEGARDWALPELDRAYCVSNSMDLSKPYADEEVPLYNIAYHGLVIYNSFRCAVNTLPGDDIYLQNIAWGGIPMIYYHHIFNPAWDASDGWANDFVYERDNVAKGVATIKKITDDVARLEPVRFAFIENYIKHDDTLTETVFSNGMNLLVNYSDNARKLPNNLIVPAKNFILK